MLRSGRSAARAVGIALVALFGCGEIDKTCPTCPVEPPVVNPPGSTLWTLGPTHPMTDVAVGPNGVYVAGNVLRLTCTDCSPPTYLPTDSDFVAKFDFDGKKQWVVNVYGHRQIRDMDADGERIYLCWMKSVSVIETVNFVEALDEKNGALLWSTSIGGGMCSGIDVSGDRVYAVNGDLFELDASNGLETGRLAPEDVGKNGTFATILQSVAASSGMVYLSGFTVKNLSTGETLPGDQEDLFVAAIRRGLKDQDWVGQKEFPRLYHSWTAVAPEANTVYVTGWFGFVPASSALAAYDLEGNFLWSTITERAVSNQVVSNGRDAFVAMLNEDEPLRRVRPNGSTMWVGSPKVNTSNIAVGNGTVYAITEDGFKRYDAATGVMKE